MTNTPDVLRLEREETAILNKAGFEAPFQVNRLKHGRNNQVICLIDADGKRAVLKRYFHHPGDQRDRLEHETRFLEYAAEVAPELVPKLIGKSYEKRFALMEWVEGAPFDGPPDKKAVEWAGHFVRILNASKNRKTAIALPIAADACLKKDHHIALLQSRLNRLRSVDDPDVLRFIEKRLTPAGQRLIAKFETMLQSEGNIGEPRVISPSDFGFHNALKRSERPPLFLDFEYAGWDGAGKMLADFLSQPRLRVSPDLRDSFEEQWINDLDQQGKELLCKWIPWWLALHGLKWCCIQLNDFLPVGRQRRQFAGDERDSHVQIAGVDEYFQSVCIPRLAELDGV